MKTKGKKSISILMAVVMTLLTFTTAMVPTIAGAVVKDHAYVRPTPAQILSDLNSTTAANGTAHPRLMLNAAKLKQLKEVCLTSPKEPYAAWYKSVVSMADKATNSSTPLLTSNDSESLTILNRILALSFVYMITTDANNKNGTAKYKDRLYQELQAVANLTWDDTSKFLAVNQNAHCFGIAYDWLYDSWTDAEKKFIKDTLVEKALKKAEIYYKDTGRTKSTTGLLTSTHNWNSCGNSGIVVGSLAIADEADYTELTTWLIAEALKIMENNINHLGPGSGYTEGPSYTQFMLRYVTMFLSALTTATGQDYGYLSLPGMSKIGYYTIGMTGQKNWFNTQDGPETTQTAPELFWYAGKYKDKYLAAYRLQQITQPGHTSNLKDILWYEEPEYFGSSSDFNTIFTTMPKDFYFENPEEVTFRNGFWNSDTSYIGMGGGKNNVNHGQLDAGNFVYESQGVRWAIDLGKENYSVANYWTYANKPSSRWTYYRCRAEGHNTFVINPNKDPNLPADQHLTNDIPILSYESTPATGKALLDMAPAYPDDVNKATRALEFDKATGKVVLTDDIEFKTASGNNLYWFMHTKAAITIAADGKSATLVQDGKTLDVKILDNTSTFTKMDAAPLPTSLASPSKTGDNTGVSKLTIHNPNAGGTYQIKVSMQVKDAPLYPIDTTTTPVNDGIKVTLNGKPIEFDQQPIIENDRTLVPFRKIFEAMEADVSWDDATQTVTAKKGDIVITLQIGNNIMMKNGQQITLDVPAKLVNDRTLVPVRAIVEGLGAKVDWDGATQTVIITTQ